MVVIAPWPRIVFTPGKGTASSIIDTGSAGVSTAPSTEQIAIAIGCELGRYDKLIALAPGELENGLGHEEEANRLIDREAFVDRLAALAAAGPVSVVGQARHLDPVLEPAIRQGLLPAPTARVEGPRLVIVEFGIDDATTP